MKMPVLALLPILMLFFSASSSAQDHAEIMREAFNQYVAGWLQDPMLVKAIRAQNQRHSSITDSQIIELDNTWRTERKNGGGALIDALMATELSLFLSDKKEAFGGLITEMFVMDSKGLNVGQSDVTSDYMQGDEGKWQKTFGIGPGAIFVGDQEFDKSTKSFQAQISATISDEDGAIGAITVGMNLEALH